MGEQAGEHLCIFEADLCVLLTMGPEPSAGSFGGALLGCVAVEATRDARGPWDRSRYDMARS